MQSTQLEPQKDDSLKNSKAQHHQFILESWRSLQDTLRSSINYENPNPNHTHKVQSQLTELSQQIDYLVETQNKLEEQTIEDEQMVRCKVMELIENLEAKHLKVSKYNKQILNEICMQSTTGFGNTLIMGKTQTQFGVTGMVLNTLNQIIREEENELEEQVKIRDDEISQLNEQISQLKEMHKRQLKEIDERNAQEKLLLNQQIEKLNIQLNKFEKLKNVISNLNVDFMKSFDGQFTNTISQLDIESQNSLNRLQKQIIELYLNAKPKQIVHSLKTSTADLLQKQLRRNSSFENTRELHHIEEPTPRFLLDQIPTSHPHINQSVLIDDSNLQMTSQSVFKSNLSLNRSLLPNQKSFSSTLNNLFRRRPKDTTENKELWAYIFELEQEIIDIQRTQQRQADESQLEISVVLGDNHAVTQAKANLEDQIEQLNIENQMKTLRIGRLEKFNEKFTKTIRESKELFEQKESSFILNLRGILSPRQFNKLRDVLSNNVIAKNATKTFEDQNISVIDQEQPNNLSALFDQDHSYFLKETRLINDSKNNTTNLISFRQNALQIQSSDQNIVNDPSFLPFSPVNVQPSQFRNQRQKFFMNQKQKSMLKQNLVLIQDQLDTSLDRANESFIKMNQNDNSQIFETFNQCSSNNDPCITTQNNKTLQRLLLNQSSVDSQNGQNFGFSRSRLNMRGGAKRGGMMRSTSQGLNKSVNDTQQSNNLIQQIHDNFQSQLQELKDEKVKLIQILSKFLNLPVSSLTATLNPSPGNQDVSSLSLDDILNAQSQFDTTKSILDDFKMQITQAISKQQLDLSKYDQQQSQLQLDREKIEKEKLKMEQHRINYNQKVTKLKEKTEELQKKHQLIEERDKLLEQQEQKIKFRKQAMDQEWKRIDKMKIEVEQEKALITKEWEKLQHEVREINTIRQEQKLQRSQLKDMKYRFYEERKLVEKERSQIDKEKDEITEKEKIIKAKEMQLDRESQRIQRDREMIRSEFLEIDKQKQYIKDQRELIDQDRKELEEKRSLSGMFIPDLKQLIAQKGKSANRSYINDGKEHRIRNYNSTSSTVEPSNVTLTNMNAYINKCQCQGNADTSGIYNCDIHKAMNKSSISLSSVSVNRQYQQNQTSMVIGSGRPTYKNYQSSAANQQANKTFMRNQSFKQFETQLSKKSLNASSFIFPQNVSSIESKKEQKSPQIDDEDKENVIPSLDVRKFKKSTGLESFLMDTAKFKESYLKLQSYNSLLESKVRIGQKLSGKNKEAAKLNDTFNSFDSIENIGGGATNEFDIGDDEYGDELLNNTSSNLHQMSKEEL